VKPAPFLYERPTSVEEVVTLLREHGDEAKLLAGGQSLVPLLNLRLTRPEVIVDINRVAGLDGRDGRRVGAMVRQRELSGIPLVELAMPFVGHYVTRNRGTVGGSIAHADASAELPLCLLVLGGSVHTSSGRELPADDFFVSHFTTALREDELLVGTSWPEGEAVGFAEFALRHGDFALSACACSLALHEGTITAARVGVGAVVDRPQLLELDLVGAPATPETARAAGARATALVDPFGNQHVSAAYLRSLTGVLVERALTQAFERAAA
jgi:2-furoyl-CoA dehydrogenase FAD binding subunit